jgi:hypothetical protein
VEDSQKVDQGQSNNNNNNAGEDEDEEDDWECNLDNMDKITAKVEELVIQASEDVEDRLEVISHLFVSLEVAGIKSLT